jgi:hypothetical protein
VAVAPGAAAVSVGAAAMLVTVATGVGGALTVGVSAAPPHAVSKRLAPSPMALTTAHGCRLIITFLL